MLERIEVQDYQSLEDIDLALGRFTVIVGPSGNGKSALIRALKALCFNQVGSRFIRHKQQKAWVRLTLDGGKKIEWEKPRDKGATYTSDDQAYTRVGRTVPEDIENVLGIRRIEIDKGVSFTPQFHSQHDLPLLLTESSTLAARALAKLTKLSVLVEGQMDCRRDLKRVQRDHEVAETEAGRTKAQLDELPNVRRVRNVLERANKLMRTANQRLGIAKQADDIVQDIAGSLLIADLTLPRMEEVEALEERVGALEGIVAAIQQTKKAAGAVDATQAEVGQALDDLEGLEHQYEKLVEELGACPLCGSTEAWGEHEHAS
jgi:DNA repair ATPase RecN